MVSCALHKTGIHFFPLRLSVSVSDIDVCMSTSSMPSFLIGIGKAIPVCNNVVIILSSQLASPHGDGIKG
jgi:hypothetical protein